jgi:hypothetical protein
MCHVSISPCKTCRRRGGVLSVHCDRSDVLRRLTGLLLVTAVVAGCGDSAGEQVDVALAGGQLRVSFTTRCEVSYLRMNAVDPVTGLAASDPWWEIRADDGARILNSVTTGAPPDGFSEITDRTSEPPPERLDLMVKEALIFVGRIDTGALADGGQHRVELREAMSELRPAAARRC